MVAGLTVCTCDDIVELGRLILHEYAVQVLHHSEAWHMARPRRLRRRTEALRNPL